MTDGHIIGGVLVRLLMIPQPHRQSQNYMCIYLALGRRIDGVLVMLLQILQPHRESLIFTPSYLVLGRRPDGVLFSLNTITRATLSRKKPCMANILHVKSHHAEKHIMKENSSKTSSEGKSATWEKSCMTNFLHGKGPTWEQP